jgi:hypothetical protein
LVTFGWSQVYTSFFISLQKNIHRDRETWVVLLSPADDYAGLDKTEISIENSDKIKLAVEQKLPKAKIKLSYWLFVK